MSAYNPLVPTGTVKLSFDYKNIQNNFLTANTSFGINHYPFSDGTTKNGKHKFVELVAQARPTILSGEDALYSKTATSVTNLFMTADAGGREYQLTTVNDSNFTTFGTNTAYVSSPVNGNTVAGGWTFLPGGMLLQYGEATIDNQPGQTKITYPIPFPGGTPFTIQVTAIVNSSSSGDQTASVRSTSGGTSFQAGSTSTGTVTGFYWMAIGK